MPNEPGPTYHKSGCPRSGFSDLGNHECQMNQALPTTNLGAPGPDSRTWDTTNAKRTRPDLPQIWVSQVRILGPGKPRMPNEPSPTYHKSGCPRSGFSDLGYHVCRLPLCRNLPKKTVSSSPRNFQAPRQTRYPLHVMALAPSLQRP